MALEVELKARLADPAGLRARLRTLGAEPIEERVFEDNYLLDDAEGSLTRRGEGFRIRLVGGRALLTWKGKKTLDGGVKSREEIETWCDDPAALFALLARLGYTPVLRYQKYRETWSLGSAHVCIDETPAGDFLEIEGDAEDLHRLRERLGIAAAAVVEDSYPALFARLLSERGGVNPREMVFGDRG